jgi:hypothetical protein
MQNILHNLRIMHFGGSNNNLISVKISLPQYFLCRNFLVGGEKGEMSITSDEIEDFGGRI